MKNIPVETIAMNPIVKVVIEGGNVRVKGNNKVYRYVYRNYGHGKKFAKALIEKGLKEGENDLTLEKLLSILSEVESRIDKGVKKIKKTGVDLSSEEEIIPLPKEASLSQRARRVYKKTIKSISSIPEEKTLLVKKIKGEKPKLKIELKDIGEGEELEIEDGFF